MAKAKKSGYPLLTCTPKSLPPDALLDAMRVAIATNPLNSPRVEGMLDSTRGGDGYIDAQRLGVLTTKFWGTHGVRLTVGFLDNPEVALRRRILKQMNAWAKTANVRFAESKVDPQVRISRARGAQGGYWSYLGTDILLIAKGEPTMNLEGFTVNTPAKEFRRVVRHETGHTLGFPHEHMRKKLIAAINPQKAYRYFLATQGWNKAMVDAQVLTPIEELALLNPTAPDPNSIMCYQISGEITKSGKPIPGGKDISRLDYQYVAQIYPKALKAAGELPAVTRHYSSLAPAAPRTVRGREP